MINWFIAQHISFPFNSMQRLKRSCAYTNCLLRYLIHCQNPKFKRAEIKKINGIRRSWWYEHLHIYTLCCKYVQEVSRTSVKRFNSSCAYKQTKIRTDWHTDWRTSKQPLYPCKYKYDIHVFRKAFSPIIWNLCESTYCADWRLIMIP